MSFELSNWYGEVVKADTIISYKGVLSKDDISDILNQIEIKLELNNVSPKLVRKIYNVAVEILQNIYHHGQSPDGGDDDFAAFVLKEYEENSFGIISGNYANKTKIRLLKDRLEQINYLESAELRILYKIILNNQQFSEKGGGGLGMIDIAKKTGNKLIYNFYNLDSDYFFYAFSVAIS